MIIQITDEIIKNRNVCKNDLVSKILDSLFEKESIKFTCEKKHLSITNILMNNLKFINNVYSQTVINGYTYDIIRRVVEQSLNEVDLTIKSNDAINMSVVTVEPEVREIIDYALPIGMLECISVEYGVLLFARNIKTCIKQGALLVSKNNSQKVLLTRYDKCYKGVLLGSDLDVVGLKYEDSGKVLDVKM